MLNLVLFGPPGAGKGTQSAKLIAKYGLIHLSTGDLLRAEISAGTTLGLEAKKLMDQGILVPDAVVIGMIENKLNENKDAAGFIFDGFPRTEAQAQALDNLLSGHQLAINHMIALEVSEEELTQRLLERGKTSGRSDDNEESIKKRLVTYINSTKPIIDKFKAAGKVRAVDSNRSLDEVFGDVRLNFQSAISRN